MADTLEGIHILDLSQGAAGPTCAMFLGDLGANVVKVEPPGGEWGRQLGPPFIGGVAAAFLGMNRNKRSLVVDLKRPGGPEVVLELAARCDVALESFRPGVADRLGIGYEAMSDRNPRLVYGAISAFGQEGPWRDRPGVDGVVQAMSGIMSVTGSPDGPPVKVGVPAADMAGAAFATQAVLAALFARQQTGRGQRVDISLLDALLSLQVVPVSMYLASGNSPGRLGSAAPYAAPNEAFPTKDGHVMVAAYTPDRWSRLCEVLGRPDLEVDPRFDANEKRVAGRKVLHEVLEPVFRQKTTSEWIEALDAADILCGPILSYPEVLEAEHVAGGGSIVHLEHPATGSVGGVAYPVRLSGTASRPNRPAPPLAGEHTEEVLREFEFTRTEIQGLLERGVTHAPAPEPVT